MHVTEMGCTDLLEFELKHPSYAFIPGTDPDTSPYLSQVIVMELWI